MFGIQINKLLSCLSITDTNSTEFLSVYPFLAMGGMKCNKYFVILYVGKPI